MVPSVEKRGQMTLFAHIFFSRNQVPVKYSTRW